MSFAKSSLHCHQAFLLFTTSIFASAMCYWFWTDEYHRRRDFNAGRLHKSFVNVHEIVPISIRWSNGKGKKVSKLFLFEKMNFLFDSEVVKSYIPKRLVGKFCRSGFVDLISTRKLLSRLGFLSKKKKRISENYFIQDVLKYKKLIQSILILTNLP